MSAAPNPAPPARDQTQTSDEVRATEYGEVFAQWRAGCGAPWQAYTHHAFVEGLRDGSLPRSAFLHYLIQDYLFLVHFARAWSLAVVKADTLEDMTACAGTVHALLDHEMALHVGVCAAQGIAEETLYAATEEIENLAYTRYVLDAGQQGDFLDLMAALAPCCFGYGEIGLRLARTAAPSTPYTDWIATYASENYQQVMARTGRMIDKAVTRKLGSQPAQSGRWASLQRRFDTATRLECGFWDMGLRGV